MSYRVLPKTCPSRRAGELQLVASDQFERVGVRIVLSDDHGTLQSRKLPHYLPAVEAFRQGVSYPAREAGVRVIVVSAGSPRDVDGIGRLLELEGQPAIAEGGLFWTYSLLKAPFRPTPAATPEACEGLRELTQWVNVDRHLPVGAYREPKNLMISINVAQVTAAETKRFIEKILAALTLLELPLELHRSDATIDVGPRGVNKKSAARWLLTEMDLGFEGITVCGDSDNDLPMFGLAARGKLGCPFNAQLGVKAFVRRHHGFVSRFEYLQGTLDVILRMVAKAPARGLA